VTARISLIVAVSRNGVIGNKGKLPWHIPADLKLFKTLTMGKPVIMGRKTWDSLGHNPLPGRSNIVVTRDKTFHAEGARIAYSFEDALAKARAEKPAEIMVIGGEAIYASALPVATRVYLTAIEGDFEGDARMPLIDRRVFHEAAYDGPYETAEGLGYSFLTLERKP
jgi:dihydrofolate reductase